MSDIPKTVIIYGLDNDEVGKIMNRPCFIGSEAVAFQRVLTDKEIRALNRYFTKKWMPWWRHPIIRLKVWIEEKRDKS